MKRKILLNGAVCAGFIFIASFVFSFSFINNKSGTMLPKNLSIDKKEEKMITFSTYLLFNGNCKEAMEFYKSCFGGDLTLTSVGLSPMKNIFPDSMYGRTVNAQLVSKSIDISASDWLQTDNVPVQGNMVCLYLKGGTPPQLKILFDKLSEKATIINPLKMEVFGTYGALTDQFGIRWMFHTNQKD
jgi:PhnB protein